MRTQRVRQITNRQSLYKVANLYVIEVRDKWWEWRPAKTLDRIVIVFGSKKEAEEWIAQQSSQTHPGKDFLIKTELRYRIRKIQLLPSSANGSLVTKEAANVCCGFK